MVYTEARPIREADQENLLHFLTENEETLVVMILLSVIAGWIQLFYKH